MLRAAQQSTATPLSEAQFALPNWRDVAERAHCVQFYHSDDFLIESVSGFMEAGLDIGEPVLVIATREHRQALEQRLLAHGSDIGAARARGHYVALDAVGTLQRFMVDGMPDPQLFEQTLAPVFAAVGNARTRAYGEMVALLWADGNQAAALQLEHLWNELALTHRFALLCGYPLSGFGDARQTAAFAHVCEHHAMVMPAESPAHINDEDARRREISMLQQKAAALQAEVAEREHAERELRERQATLTLATGLAGLGIWAFDVSRNVFSFCNRCKSILGADSADRHSIEQFLASLHFEDRVKAKAALDAVIYSGADLAGEYRVVTQTGQRWVAIQAKNGDLSSRVSGVMLDITAQKNAAAALEQTVAERTARLRETIADLEAFSYSISHDMRSPLRAIHGYADILMQECRLEAQHSGYLTRIGAAAKRMDRLIEDVLAFSRVARSDLALAPVEIAALVQSLVESIPALQEQNATVSVEGMLPQLMGNAAAITQCLSNLLANAVKFVTPGTKPHIRIWNEQTTDSSGQQWSRINVSDNGIGIEPELQGQIFAIFQRLSTDYEGTGIGLAIVKKAIERMGGRTGLFSQPGTGSTFWFELKTAL